MVLDAHRHGGPFLREFLRNEGKEVLHGSQTWWAFLREFLIQVGKVVLDAHRHGGPL